LIRLESNSAYKFTRHYWWLCLVLLTTAACHQKSIEANRYSDTFTPTYTKVNNLFEMNRPKEALHYLDSAFKAQSNPTYSDRFRYYGFYFNYNRKTKQDHQKALLYADSMMTMANKTAAQPQYVVNFSEANFALGDAYFDLNLFSDAFQYYYQGYLTGKNYLNNEALSDYTYRMGMIMYQKGYYKVAANYFKESYKQKSLTIAPNDFAAFFRRQELLDNIGLSYRHSNYNDSSLLYFNKALKFINENTGNFPDRRNALIMARGVVYGNKAEVYIDKKSYNNAIDLLDKSIAINLQKGFDNNDAIYAELKLAKIYNDQQETWLLKNLLADLRDQLDIVKNSVAEAEWNRLMGDYYSQDHDLKNALIHINQYNLLKDSITKQSSLLKESDVNEQLANYEKAHQIELLSNNNKVQLISIYVILAFATMALIIIFLIYRDWERSKKDVLQVNLLNQKINKQNTILENALKELKISSQEKDRILRTVAHDLRNPIGGIASLTAVMADDEYTEEQKEMINLVKETSFNSLELINEILEATNIASIELNLEQVEINSLVSNSVELLRFKAAEKNQLILFEPLKLAQELRISREKIWRVISNLISNALKFSPNATLIFVKVEKKNEEVIISVKDNGIGIPEKLKDQVFNMFTSAQRPGTAGEKSFGLGLSICKQIMEKSNGKIWFTSDKENGTIFYISLPLAEINITKQINPVSGHTTSLTI
jgi:two-component system sensor histidine kinase VicK